MPVYSWTFDGVLRKHLIEIEHVPSSGLLRLHLDRRQLLEETGIKEQGWTHHLYIDGELVVAEVRLVNGNYVYDFKEDEVQESLRITRKRKRERRVFVRYVVVGLVFMLLISLGPYLLFSKTAWYSRIRLDRGEGTVTVATCFWDNVSSSTPTLRYRFTADQKTIYGSVDTAQWLNFHTPLGMPIWTGDDFLVRYIDGFPSISAIHFEEPGARTRQRYVERAARSLLNVQNPRLNFVNRDRVQFTNCLLGNVLQEYGIAAVAHIYLREQRGHAAAYNNLVEEEGYRWIEKECYRISSDSASTET
jgi:hypothetical protein